MNDPENDRLDLKWAAAVKAQVAQNLDEAVACATAKTPAAFVNRRPDQPIAVLVYVGPDACELFEALITAIATYKEAVEGQGSVFVRRPLQPPEPPPGPSMN